METSPILLEQDCFQGVFIMVQSPKDLDEIDRLLMLILQKKVLLKEQKNTRYTTQVNYSFSCVCSFDKINVLFLSRHPRTYPTA